RFLENLGYAVTAFTDSSKALKAFRANPDRFDLVVTDQSMPKMTGERLVPKLRKIRGDIPIILCTGHSATINPENSKAIGINAFLYKPVAQQVLGRAVREVLDGAKLA
ncbi:MAG: response regulator, partial [bacterium]